jgi:hypothetical protein
MIQSPARRKITTARVCLIGAALCVGLIIVFAWLFEKGRHTAEVRGANDLVARRLQTARSFIADREFERAIDHLQATLAIEKATSLESARQLLDEVRQAQAESLLEAGAAALEKDHRGHAIQLLQRYVAHPFAANRARAATLLVEAGRRDKADEIQRGQEQRQTDDRQRQESRDQRLVRMKATPVVRELQEFVALVRKQEKRNREMLEKEEQQLLASLLQAQRGKKEIKPLAAVDTLGKRQDGKDAAILAARWRDALEEAISVKRANFKERFRSYPDFDRTDWEAFDHLVDTSLDQLLEEINKPVEDNVADGLQALTGK